MDSEVYSISQVAARFGLRVSALRYYDEIGLLRPAERRGTVRYYGRAELHRLALIQRLHHRGLVSLADTTILLTENPAERDGNARDVLTRSIQGLKDEIENLQAAQRLLEHLLSCPAENPVRECTFLHDELDRAVETALNSGA
ncbi:MerR family transcriptional regulator [Amycolatopsis anabasis]|uniref:MerR family transcriptional regulator n=1 Tax=Amycolatopsis anabasis TaxID=1840409 RepID=UPI00131BD734|nr:MerR family transcriptional regulator [Amycolatopsis anabasis]